MGSFYSFMGLCMVSTKVVKIIRELIMKELTNSVIVRNKAKAQLLGGLQPREIQFSNLEFVCIGVSCVKCATLELQQTSTLTYIQDLILLL